MSQFIDTLGRAGEQTPTPMGFGAQARDRSATPSMLIVGKGTPQVLSDGPDPEGAAVDAILVALDAWDEKALGAAVARLGEGPWGVRARGISTDQTKYLVGKGCDFVIFDAEHTAAGVLSEEALGKVISVPSTLDDDSARALADLPFDAAFLVPNAGTFPMTVETLMAVVQVRGLLDTPLVLEAPGDLSVEDLTALRNVGIAGLVLDVSAPEDIARTREAVAALPRRKPRPTRAGALVPRGGVESETPVPPDEDDDEEY